MDSFENLPNPAPPTGPSRFWIGLIIALVVLALLAAGVIFALSELFKQTTSQLLSPVTNTSNRIETQMAELRNPTPTILPDPITIVHDVRSLARLETIQYTLEKVVTAETNQDQLSFLFGDKLLFVAHGRVIAGIDMARLRPQDVRVEGSVLYVTLPPAEIFVATLDNEKSYVYNRETGLLTRPGQDLETQARIVAEREILKAAVEDGILAQAQQNGESYLSRLFLSMGYKEVIFTSATPAPSATETPQP